MMLVAIVCGSCSDDNDSPGTQQPNVLTFSVPAVFFTGGEHRLILSDNTGKVLAEYVMQNDTTYSFEAPADFKSTNITMTLTTDVPEWGVAQIATYCDIPFGAYGYPTYVPPATRQNKGRATVALDDVPYDPNQRTPQATSGDETSLPPSSGRGDKGLAFNMTLTAEKSAFMVSEWRQGYLYYLYQEVEPGQTYRHTLTDFVRADEVTMTAPPAKNMGFVVGGINAYGDFERYTSLPFGLTSSAPITLRVPYPGNIFTSYFMYVSFETGDADNLYFKRGALSTQVKSIEGSLSYTLNGNVIESNAPDACDVVIYRVDDDWSHTAKGLVWDVYVQPGKQIVTLPPLPVAVAEAYGATSFETAYTAASTSSTALYDYTEYSVLADFVKHELANDLDESNEYISKTTYPVSGIGGGRLESKRQTWESFMEKINERRKLRQQVLN